MFFEFALFALFVVFLNRIYYWSLEWRKMPVMSEEEIIRAARKPVRYPFAVVWTPIPALTWIIPFIGHTGITTAEGKIRDFAGSYYVAEDDMAFGKPTKIWTLDPSRVKNGISGYNNAVFEASLDYGGRIHNLLFDNCHSHVARALNLMEYDGSTKWNMFKIAWYTFLHGQHISTKAWLKSWGPFWVLLIIVASIVLLTQCTR